MHDDHQLDDAALLALWEAALGCNIAQREDLLVAAATHGEPAPRALGARNAALLRWRRRMSGRTLPMRATCARCAAELDLPLDIDMLCPPRADASGAVGTRLRIGGHDVRLEPLTIDDLRELAAQHADVDSLAGALLERCVVGDDGSDVAALVTASRAELVARLEALDSCASITIALVCPDCGHAWSAPLDVAPTLWAELRRRAEQLLVDVATLAREFGWAERELIAMTPTRRMAYLQLAGAA
jgi:hypothetical protein